MLTVLKDNLATALLLTGEAISRDKNIPIRSHIRLTASNSSLALSATDLMTAVVLNIGAKVEQPLDITVSHAELKDFIEAARALPETQIGLQLIGLKLRVTCARVVQEFGTLPASDFPLIQKASSEASVSFSAVTFDSAIRSVADFALADKNPAQPILTGIRVKFKKVKDVCGLSFTASDGNSAAISAMPLIELPEAWAGTSLVLPASSVLKACNILKGQEMVAFSRPDANRIQLTTPHIMVTLMALDGGYPDVEKIIPRSGAVTATFPISELLKHVKISLLVNFKLALQFDSGEPGHLRVNTIGEGIDPRTSSLTLDGAITGSLLIGANGRYVKRALEGLEDLGVSTVQITLNAPTTPIGIQPVGADLNKPVAQYVFAPMRLGPIPQTIAAPELVGA